MEILSPFLGIFTCLVLFYYRKSFNKTNLYLALFFLCSNLIVIVYFGLHFSNNPFLEGVFFINFMPLSFVIGPLLFFYVKYAVAKNKKFITRDLLHLLPVVFVIIFSLPYTALTFSKKIEIAHYIQSVTHDYDYSISFFSLKQMLFLRPLHLFFYCILSLIYFKLDSSRRKTDFGALPINHSILKKWIYSLISIQLIISTYCFMDSFAGWVLNDFGTIFNQKNYFRVLGSAFFVQNTILFLFPKILFDSISYPDASLAKNLNIQLQKSNSNELNTNIKIQLNQYLLELPYIKNDFNLTKMALDLKISERILSNYFNTELSVTFSKWKNDKRIEHACEMIQDGKGNSITVEGIALNVGFLSRSKFIDAFKSRKGVPPSTYIKQFCDLK
jgi:AraC-like DNA-binding protein